jgi:hypothetical protein
MYDAITLTNHPGREVKLRRLDIHELRVVRQLAKVGRLISENPQGHTCLTALALHYLLSIDC